jgi:Ca-activated chloride channel homolog
MRYTFAFFIAFSCSLFAQQQAPRLVTALDAKAEPVQLSKMDVAVKILGEIAETRTTMTFYNPHSRVLEGNLHFPLPEGATISGYALDVNGIMVDGVVVEKHEARRVFEREERKGVDPGLVEWLKGNNFQTRVYPIPARGSRTVMVRYVSELPRISGQTSYSLPLNHGGKIKQLHIRVDVIRASSRPVVTKGAPGNFAFSNWNNSYVAEANLENAVLHEDMLIVLPDVEKIPIRVEKSAGGKYYFAINDHEAASFIPQIDTLQPPSRIALYWDASGSRGMIDHKRELALLEMLFAKWKEKPVTVDLIRFSNKAEPSRSFSIVKGDARELLDALRATAYDGGTQMAAISPAVNSVVPDFYLLFTDGLSNFGSEKPAGFKAPLYALSADPTSNHAFLSWLALSAQGQYFNQAQVDDKTIVESIGAPAYRFMAARYDKAAIQEPYPKTPEPVHGRFILAGKLVAPGAEILLEFGAQGRVLKTVKYVVQQQDASEGNLIGTLWAQKKIKELLAFPEINQEALTAIGKQYGLVTPGTSLLVLERLEQYIDYGITPPESLPEMRNKYLEQMAERKKEEKENKKEKLERILELWSERVKWWETDFSETKKEVKKKIVTRPAAIASPGSGSGGGVGGGTGSGVGSGQAGSVLSSEQVAALPMVNRDALDLLEVESGVSAASVNIQREGVTANDARWPAGINAATRINPGLIAAFSSVDSTGQASIAVQGWDPETPYIEELKRATPLEYAKIYQQERKAYGDSPAFFLDCADFFFKNKRPALGLRVLSNIAELQLENPAFLRILAQRLTQLGYTKLSVPLFETILKMRPEEPQSYRDLALALAEQKKYRRAMELLNHVVMNEWDRFEEIEVIALMELNRMIPLARAQGIKTMPLDPRLVRLLDVDIRIVLTWDADMTDIDLWVTEPSGEKAFYSDPLTAAGGHVSKDFTEGYGPEEYVIHRAAPGKYLIQANFYGSQAQNLQGPVTVQATVYTNYGRANEKRRRLTLRLGEQKDTFTVGEIVF